MAGCVRVDAPKTLGTSPCENTFIAKVERIVDGDTLDVASCTRIRLALVNAPERGEEGYEEATAFTSNLCPVGLNAVVDLDSGQPIDATSTRLVAVVHCSGKNLNAELLRSGHAVILTRSCDVSDFADDDWARDSCSGHR